jgi:hypothetical protein
VYLQMLRCGNIALQTVTHFDVGKFITNFLQTLIHDCWFETSFLPPFTWKYLNKILIWYFGKWSNTRSSF